MSLKQRKLCVRILVTIAVALLAFIFIFPFLWMLSTSFKFETAVFDYPFRFIPKEWNFGTYQRVFRDSQFPIFYRNSLIIAVCSVCGNMCLSSTAAYAFARLRFRGRNAIFALYMMTLMIPVQVLLLPKYVIFQKIGLYDHWAALILPAMISPFATFFLRQSYMSIPMELTEAGRMDGAGQWHIYLRLILPLVKGPIMTVAVLAFIDSWNDYMQPAILLRTVTKYTVPIGLEWFSSSVSTDYSQIMAATVVSVLPILIAFILTQKYYIESIAAVGVKG